MGFFGFRGKRKKTSKRSSTRRLSLVTRGLLFEPLEDRHLLTVTFNAITGPDAGGAYNIPTGKDLYVPLTASDPGQTITYTASTTNSSVTATVLTGNPELVLNVSGTDSTGQAFSGTLTFVLFQNIAPGTVAAIIQDVDNGIYTNASFYRMETSTGFQLIQGGTEFDSTQPTATPATVPNEFNANAAYNSPGLLAMASSQNSSGVKSASTEFFVTAPNIPLSQEPQSLNYGYAVFGQLLSDPSGVYSKILHVPTTSQNGINYANTPVTITSASIVTTDTQNAVLQISEPDGFTGNATVTVTATGSDSSSKQEAFNVDVVAASAGGSYLYMNALSNLTTQSGKAVSFTVSATDAASGTPTFAVGDQEPFGQSPYPALTNFTVTVTPGANNTATVTLTPKAGFTGTATLVMHADDTANGIADAQEFTVTVTGPLTVATPGTTQDVKAGNTLSVTGVSVSDPGLPTTSNVTTTLTVGHGTLTLLTNVTNGLTASEIQGNGTGTVTITAPLAALNATLIASNGLVYAPASGYGGADSLEIKSNDGATFGNTADVTLPLAVLADILIGVPSAAPVTAMNIAVNITGLSLSDQNLPATDLVTLTFQPGHGTLFLSTSVQGGITADEVQQNGTGSVTVSATLAAINATLAATGGVAYTPNSGFNGTDTVQVQANDPVQNSSTNNFSVVVGLTFTAPTSVEAPSNTYFGIQGISINDPALSATNTLSLTLSVSQGVLKVSTSATGGLDASGVTGNSSASVVLTGTLAQINATLAATKGLQYKSTVNYTGPDTLSLSATDQLNSANTGSVALTVIGPIAMNVPNSATIPANTPFALAGASIDDTGLPATDNVTFALQAANGTLNLNTSVNGGLTAAQISNNNSGSVTVTGTLAAINATLAAQGGLTYTPNNNFAGNETLTFTATDSATNSDPETTSLLVLGPLTVTVPTGVQAVVTGGTLNVPTITVADPGLTGFADITVVFKATNGVLNFSTSVSSGLIAGEISGNGTDTVTVTAPPSELNTTLAATGGFIYTPNSGYNGADAISVTATDLAGTQVTQSVTLAVGLTINLPSGVLLPSGSASVISGVSISDAALSASQTVTLVFSVQSGTLNVSTTVANGITQVQNNGTASVTFTGTVAQINATLADAHGLTYTPTSGFNGNDTLSAAANDQMAGSNSENTALTIVGPISVTAPSTQQNVPAGVSQSITGVSIADPSLPSTSNVTVVLTAQHGTLALLSSVSGGITASEIQNNGTATVTITATLAQINATLAASGGLTYTSASGFAGADTLNYQVTDTATNTQSVQTPLLVAGPISVTGPSTTQLIQVNGTLAVTSLSVSDPSLPSGQGVTLTITASHGTINLSTSVSGGITSGQITGNGTGTVQINASLAAINATLAATGGMTYTATTGFNGTDTIGFAASDTVGNTNSSTSVAVAVIGPMTVTGPSGTTTLGSAASTPITGFVLTDTSLPSTSNVTATLSAGHGTITLLTNVTGGLTASQIAGNGTSNLTITAPLAAINATLAASGGLVYKGISGYSGSDAISLSATDSVSNTNSASATLGVIGPLSITAPSTLSANENNSAVVTGISLADPQLPSTNNVTLTITATHGVISLSTAVSGGLTSSQITGNGTASLSITAPLAAINATLAAATGVTYTPTAGVNGSDTLVFTGSDTFSNTQTSNVAVTILPISSSSLSGFVYLDSNQNSTFDASEMGLADVILILQGTNSQNVAVGPFAVKTDSKGSFQFNSLPAGTYTLTKMAPADLADGHATAGSLGGTVQGSDVIGSITLGSSATGTGYDFGEDGVAPKYVTLNMFLNTSPTPLQTLVNYIDKSYADAGISTTAPVGISGNVAAPTVSATPSSFNVSQGATATVAGVQVNDNSLSSTTSNVQVTATVNNGTLAVSSSVTGGASSSQVTGSGTSSVTITAPLATINTTLSGGGLTYTPNSAFSGSDSLSIGVSDLGNTTTGTAQTGSTTVTITVIAAPTITSTNASLATGTGKTLNVSGVTVGDTALNSGANVQLQLGAAHGTINVSTTLSGGITSAQVSNNGTGNVTITAPLSAINAVLAATAGVTYTPSSGYVGSDTFGMTLSDLGNTVSGTAQTATKSLPVSVAGPLAITPATGTLSLGANASLALTGYALTDPSLPTTTNVTMTFQATNGVINVATAISAGITSSQITGNGTGSVTITAPLAAINATLAGAAGLTYTPGSSFDGSDTVSMGASDSLGNTTTASLTITS